MNHKNAMPEGLSVVNPYFPINHAYRYLDLVAFFCILKSLFVSRDLRWMSNLDLNSFIYNQLSLIRSPRDQRFISILYPFLVVRIKGSLS